MSYENRKREYERVKALGKIPPERLIKEFGAKEIPKVIEPKEKKKKGKK